MSGLKHSRLFPIYIFALTACKTGEFGVDCAETCGSCRYGEPCGKTDGVCRNGCELGKQPPLCKTGMCTLNFKGRGAILAASGL